jgi:hypothetical protein
MSEERKKILDMLGDGKINAEQAERLIAALSGGGSGASDDAGSSKPLKYLRVIVDAESHPGQPPTKVNVRVPMQLLRAGMRLSALIPAQARDQVNHALHEQGIPLDLGQIKPENLEALIEQLRDLTVDVDDPKAKVRVFCE